MLRFGKERTSLLPSLEVIQETLSYIPEKSVAYLSETFHLPVAEIYSVISFYGMLTAKKKGKFVIRVCDSLSCHINHSIDVVKDIREILNIKPGETTPDEIFTLETVDCLGSCDQAPVMMVNEKLYGKLTRKTLKVILNDLKTGGR